MERPFRESAIFAKKIVWDVIGNHTPVGTWIQRTQTADGADAIKIVIVFPDVRADEVTGDQLLRIMSAIRTGLPEIGEDRFPMVSFARQADEAELEGDRFNASA